MPALKKIEQSLNHLFQIEKYGKDSAISTIITANRNTRSLWIT